MTTTTVQAGYKMTEIGVIPEDWEVRDLGDIGEIKMCRRVFSHETKTTGVIPFYKIGTFGKEADAYISRKLYESYKKRFSFPRRGEILLSAAGTIGRTVIYDGKSAYFQDSNIVWIDNNEKLISNKYLYYIYKVVKYDTEGGTIQRLYNNIIKNAKFAKPSKPEQQAIATVLSDTDELIRSLSALIAKKRQIKQGAMQELLTGKKRLAGFSGEWEVKKLGEIGEIQKGELITEKMLVCGHIPVIAGGKKPAYFHNKANRINPTITVSASGASAGYVAKHNYPIFASDCSTIEGKNNSDLNFIFYLLKNSQNRIYYMQTGGAQPHIHPKDLAPMKFSVPKDKEEQKAIAQILSDMDSEITALEQKREKYRLVKQGMMQQLLTGKIRLVTK